MFSRSFIFLLHLILFLQMHLFRYTEFIKTTLATFAACVQMKGPATCLYLTTWESPGCTKLFATVPSCPTTPWSHTRGKKGEGVRACCSCALLCLNQVLTELGSYKWLPDSVPLPSPSKTLHRGVSGLIAFTKATDLALKHFLLLIAGTQMA